MTDYSFDSWNPDYGAAPAPSSNQPEPLPSSEARRSVDVSGVYIDGAGAASLGFADTITFGFLDEISATGDWLFSFGDTSYDEALAYNRAILQKADEEHSGSFVSGQLAGGFVPVAGWAGRAKGVADASRAANAARGLSTTSSMAKSMMLAGAAQGALYGYGSTDADSLFSMDRAQGALFGGVLGGTFGYTLGAAIVPVGSMLKSGAQRLGLQIRHGKTQAMVDDFADDAFDEIDFTANVSNAAAKGSDDVVEELAEVATVAGAKGAAAPKPVIKNIITGQADDVVEEGAVLSMKDLKGDPSKARKTIENRVKKMSVEEAQILARRLDKAEELGGVIKDPHYRSLLGIDVSAAKMTADQAHRAAILLEEATEAVVRKAGSAPKTLKQIENDFRKQFEGKLAQSEIDEAVDRVAKLTTDVRIADHITMLASVQFSKATKVILPAVKEGVEGARDNLASTIAQSMSLMARGNYIKSQAGRALSSLRTQAKLGVDEVVDDVEELSDVAAIEARIRASIDELGDLELETMLKRARNNRDISEILTVLDNVEDAKTVGKFLRLQRSMVSFVQSNLLTPATAFFNVAGFILHDIFRNHLAPRMAHYTLKRAGMADEAFDLALETKIADRVYIQTHAAGLQAMLKRIKWEHWENVEKVATLKGNTAKISKAASARQKLLDEGYEPAPLREFDTAARATVTNPRAFNEQMSQLENKGGFASVWAAAQRAGAAGAQRLDAAGTLTAKLATGAMDAWGSNMVMLKETYRLAARYAVREGRKLDLVGKELADFVEKRGIELAEFPPAKLLREAEEQLLSSGQVDEATTFMLGVKQQAKSEADKVLFLDGPQTKPMKALAGVLNDTKDVIGVDIVRTAIFPYVNTPARIFERGMINYTPWGHKAREVQGILAKGGPEAAMEVARMELGGLVIGMGAILGAAGGITITNGGYKNTGNLTGKPTNRVNLGEDAYVEFGRLDPFAYSLALGGIIGQAIHARDKSVQMGYAEEEALLTATHIAMLSFREAVLDKSYLTGVRKVAQALAQGSDADSTTGLQKLGKELFDTTLISQVPMSGTMRQVSDSIRGEAPEAITLMEQALRLIPGAPTATKRDWLGTPVDGRFMGVNAGSKSAAPLRQKLADMGLDLADIERRDRLGFGLTGEQLDQLREIRATEARTRDGLSLYEALEATLEDPSFNALPTRAARKAEIQNILDGLNKDAREIMEQRNPEYAANRIGYKSLAEYIKGGSTNSQAERQVREDLDAMGLPDPDF